MGTPRRAGGWGMGEHPPWLTDAQALPSFRGTLPKNTKGVSWACMTVIGTKKPHAIENEN